MTGDLNNCRVCGFRFDSPPWGRDGRNPTFAICPCCFAEAGNDDVSVDLVRRYREEWMARGAPWSAEDEAPDGLTTEERLTHVPPGYEQP